MSDRNPDNIMLSADRMNLWDGMIVMGFRGKLTSGPEGAVLELHIDRGMVNALMADSRKYGAAKPQYKKADLRKHYFIMTRPVMDRISEHHMLVVYGDPSVDEVMFDVFFDNELEDGTIESHPVERFWYTRELYENINWKTFSPGNLVRSAPTFRYSTWLLQQIARECRPKW